MTRRPQQLAWPDLVWSHFSRPRFGGFDERVRAASEAGFTAIGVYIHEFARLLNEEGRTAATIAAQLHSHGLCLGEIEALRGWWTTGDARAEYDRAEALAVQMADGIGARYLQVIGPYDCSFQQAADALGRLCDVMARHHVLVGIEFLPYTNIADADAAMALVSAVGRANAGVCVDIWHHERGANDLDMLRRLPGDRVFAVQMNDGPLVPTIADYKTDCLANRVAPGEGQFDCVGFVRVLQEIGVTAPISLEIASESMWLLSADECARRAVDGMRRVLAAANA